MTPDIELALDARAENIAIVRHVLGSLGEAYELPEEKLSDIRLAVTEACANVVVHAYPASERGQMEVVASVEPETLTVLVRDWGRGIRPRPDSPGLGLGLSLIAALAESVQLGHGDEEHTEVRMTFALGEPVASTSTAASTSTGAIGSLGGTSARPDMGSSTGVSSPTGMNSQTGVNGSGA